MQTRSLTFWASFRFGPSGRQTKVADEICFSGGREVVEREKGEGRVGGREGGGMGVFGGGIRPCMYLSMHPPSHPTNRYTSYERHTK